MYSLQAPAVRDITALCARHYVMSLAKNSISIINSSIQRIQYLEQSVIDDNLMTAILRHYEICNRGQYKRAFDSTEDLWSLYRNMSFIYLFHAVELQ